LGSIGSANRVLVSLLSCCCLCSQSDKPARVCKSS
jgi:hypothetical protein